MLLFMYYENKIINYSYQEQLQDLLPSLALSGLMGAIVYMIQFLSVPKGVALILQIFGGAGFYLLVSYILHFEPFIYLMKMVKERIVSKNKFIN